MLTDQQENFAKAVALDGMNFSDAYRSAYDTENMLPSSIWTEASLLKDNPKVAQRINELRLLVASPKIMTAQERKEWLTEVIKNSNEATKNRLSASDQLNKMEGLYVQKVEADVNEKVTINIELSDD